MEKGEGKLINLFTKPRKIGLIGDANVGKSNFLYHLISKVREKYDFNLFTFGLKNKLKDAKEIFSLQELEQIRDSIIVLDEFFSLFNLEDRKKRRAIERTFRLIYHNNNVLILSGLPDNFKKFVSSVLDVFIFQKCTLSSFINGSRAKVICTNYSGDELGSSVLNLKIGEAILYDKHYTKLVIPYMEEFDSKKNNRPLIRAKKMCEKNVQKTSEKKGET